MLKTCFVVLYVILALFILKIILIDAPVVSINAFNPRLEKIEENVHRGTIYDCFGLPLARSTVNPDGTEHREYPYGEILSQAVGYSASEKGGLELDMNTWLMKPTTTMDFFRYWFLDQKVSGYNVATSLDAELSRCAYEQLGALNGAVVITDAATGQLLTLISKPSFTPETVLDHWEELQDDPSMPLFNRAVKGLYPPGSTFKLITSLAWIRSSAYDPDFTYTCQGSDYFNGFQLPCFGWHVHGTIGIEQAIAHSCNTFFATVGIETGAKDLIATMDSLGFNEERSELPGGVSSTYALEEDCDTEELAISSIGQGTILMTPLELNRVTCAIANQGSFVEYSMVDRVFAPDGTIPSDSPASIPAGKKKTQLMSAKEAAWIRSMMAAATDYGTAEEMAVLGVPVYGKTGTAENESDYSHSWFTGFIDAPNGHPIAITVLVEQSGGRLYAATLATRMLRFYLDSHF